MYLCKLRFFPDFYVCATTRPSFAGLLRHSVTTGSHEPVIQIPISVIWHQQQCLFKRENMAYFREYIIRLKDYFSSCFVVMLGLLWVGHCLRDLRVLV